MYSRASNFIILDVGLPVALSIVKPMFQIRQILSCTSSICFSICKHFKQEQRHQRTQRIFLEHYYFSLK